MANIHNTGLERKPAPLLIFDALVVLPRQMAQMKGETLLWKTFIEDHPDDIRGINRAGDRLTGMLQVAAHPLKILAEGTKESASIRAFNDELTNFYAKCENKQERTNTNKQIFAQITLLEERAAGLPAAYEKDLKQTWLFALSKTITSIGNIYLSSTFKALVDNSKLPKSKLKPKQIIELYEK